MFWFILSLILIVAGAIVMLTAKAMSRDYSPWLPRLGGAAGLVLGLIILGFTLVATVGPSDVGIKTSFGHVDGDIGPGIHLVAPWQTVTIWDDSIQQTQFTGKNCLQIRIAGQQSACLDVNIFWKDNPAGSDNQFRSYRTFSRVANAYTSRSVITRFFNNVFERFNPVAEVAAGTTSGTTVSSLAEQVLANTRHSYAGTIYIQTLSAGQIKYDSQVESALSSVIKAKANTAVALQNEQTAKDQRVANQDEQTALTPQVVQQNCLNMTQTQLQAGNMLPQGWNCMGASSVGVLAGK
jgi:regulator of protease activity HflC (stomatin/prohibitin superfamily)